MTTSSFIESDSLPDEDDDQNGDEEEEDAEDDAGDGDVSGLTTQHPSIGKLSLVLGALGLKQHRAV